MKKDIQNRFRELIDSLFSVAWQATEAENKYLTDGKWDDEKISKNPYTTREKLTKSYWKHKEYFENINKELWELVIVSSGIDGLMNEIESNINQCFHIKGYIKNFIKRLYEPIQWDKEYSINENNVTFGYFGGSAFERLDHYIKVFLMHLNSLCDSYDVNLSLVIKELNKKYTDAGKNKKPHHFTTRIFTDTERQNLFSGLVNNGLISKDTSTDHFNFVFGGTETKNFEPLTWVGTIKELNYFISSYFSLEKNKWDITINCFVWNNDTINKKSLSTAIDKYDNKPEKSMLIDNLLK